MKYIDVLENLKKLKSLFDSMLKFLPQGKEIVQSLTSAIDILEKEKDYLGEKYD